MSPERVKAALQATRKEFGIHEREWQHLCFEGSHVDEIVEFAIHQAAKEIFTKFDEYSCIKNDWWYLDLKKEWIGGGNDGTKQL